MMRRMSNFCVFESWWVQCDFVDAGIGALHVDSSIRLKRCSINRTRNSDKVKNLKFLQIC